MFKLHFTSVTRINVKDASWKIWSSTSHSRLHSQWSLSSSCDVRPNGSWIGKRREEKRRRRTKRAVSSFFSELGDSSYFYGNGKKKELSLRKVSDYEVSCENFGPSLDSSRRFCQDASIALISITVFESRWRFAPKHNVALKYEWIE